MRVAPNLSTRSLALALAWALAACSTHYAEVPPRLDLQPVGRVGLVTFATEAEKSSLARLATQRFAEAVLQSQSGIELVELDLGAGGSTDGTVTDDPRAQLAAAMERRGLAAVFLGQLVVSGTKAKAQVTSPTDIRVRAGVRAELAVQLLNTRTGGTMWRSSASATGTVGQVAFDGGLPSIAARDTDDAWSEVIDQLTTDVTRDLRPTWVRQ